MLFSFVKRRYWWLRYIYRLTKRFSAILLKKKKPFKIFFNFKNRKVLIGSPKLSFLSVHSRAWVFLILKKNFQRRAFSFNFLISKTR